MATKEEIREYFAKFGSQGGKATAKKRTAQERSDAARKAVQARWAKADKRITEALKETKALLKQAQKRKRSKRKD